MHKETGMLARYFSNNKEDLLKDEFIKELSGYTKGSVIIGNALADKLGIAKNNKINVLSANNVSTPFGKLPQQFTYKVASTFSSGVSELDYNYIFIPYNDALEFIKNNKNLTVTDIKMSRFMMTLEDAVDLVFYAWTHGSNGDIFVQKAPAATLDTLASALISIYKSKKIILKNVSLNNIHDVKPFHLKLDNY